MESASCSLLHQNDQASPGHSHKRGLHSTQGKLSGLEKFLLRGFASPSSQNAGICAEERNSGAHADDSPPCKRSALSPSETTEEKWPGDLCDRCDTPASSRSAFPQTGCFLTSFGLSPDRNTLGGEERPEKKDRLKEDSVLQVLDESLDGAGADWSWILELDDFGKDCENVDAYEPMEMPENDLQDASSWHGGENASEEDGLFEGGCKDVSFKESFYSSGTDWSCLYTVDDYGIPCRCNDDCDTADRIRSGKVVAKPANRKAHGRLVQSRLTACWESKSISMVRFEGSEGVAVESKHLASPVSKFWDNFKSAPARTSPVVLGKPPHSEAARRYTNAKSVPSQGRQCPFYKKIPGTSFTVDAFRYGAIYGCSAYFLTHFHADHYGGLTKSWSHGPIYCTPVTARLLVLCLSVDNRWIYPIPVGATRIVEGIEVKMLEANHCPGAAIILFCLKNGQSILHTGDFRACKSMQSYPELMEYRINTLFLDTTYCNPRYRFPPQKEVIDFVVQITHAAIKKNSRTLIVVGAYSIGKERVYLGIAEALKISIFVERRRSRILGALEWPELANRLCTDAANTMLHVLPLGFLRPERLRSYLRTYPKFSSILAFRPTGWTYSEKIGNQLHLLKPVVSGPATIYGVPYSEHSSFTEMRDFVQFLHPERIIPTVNNGRPQNRDRMQSHFRQWLVKQA